jgi:hypothetical protein
VKLGCPAGSGRCTGTVRLLAKGHRIAGRHYAIRAGHAKRVTLRLNRTGARLLRRSGGHQKVTVRAAGAHRSMVLRHSR